MKERKELPSCFISLLEDRIVHVEMKAIKEMSLKDVIQIYDEIERIGKGQKMCVLTTFNGFISSRNKEISKYAASERARKLVLCNAYVLNSRALRIAVKFFIRFQKQETVRIVFENKRDALKWLRSVRDEMPVPAST